MMEKEIENTSAGVERPPLPWLIAFIFRGPGSTQTTGTFTYGTPQTRS